MHQLHSSIKPDSLILMVLLKTLNNKLYGRKKFHFISLSTWYEIYSKSSSIQSDLTTEKRERKRLPDWIR